MELAPIQRYVNVDHLSRVLSNFVIIALLLLLCEKE